ncbi:MAG TPA: hypothetical protein PKB03_04230, partial [Baekduia sp.]|nr:hypothetical protein [Baekduia sp.]
VDSHGLRLLPFYADCLIGEINSTKTGGFVELTAPGSSVFLKLGEAWGDVDADLVHRQMIRRTIKEHFEKELRLKPRGVKVLSLFFIDAVAKYRQYSTGGEPQKGLHAQIFEEEFLAVAKQPTFKELFDGKDLAAEASDAHEGYFSIDKKGGWTDTSESNQTSRDAAERAYNLIMKEKEKLLSLSTPLRFIFSHSALREGWDNPNVFQICTLRDMGTERERRQTIGRGLRLCVNQDGERLHGFEINTLTVIATEGYEAFAEGLQKEIEEDTGIRFGVVERHQFVAVAVVDTNGTTVPLGVDASDEIWQHLKTSGYVDAKGRVQDALRQALKDGTLDVPDAYLEQAPEITAILRKLAGRLDVKNADERRVVGTRQSVLTSPEFTALWDRIKSKTTYRVNFDNEALIMSCIDELKDAPAIPKARLQWRTADIAIGEAGVEATETGGAGTIVLDPGDLPLPDVLTDLQDRTQLTRRSILRIVLESDRLKEFRQNPQAYIQLAADVINRRKQFALVDGIKYQRIGEDAYYAQQLFESEELTGYVKNMLTGTEKSPYAAVIYDSDVEKTFATDLENNTAVKLYTKLPGWFKVPTPLGSYNPDWAILVQEDDQERVYFVVETKGKLLEIREGEKAKIACGRRHFDALAEGESPARYLAAESLADVLSQA